MANLEKLRAASLFRRTRYFSEEFKRKKVEELDKGFITVAEISREYQVTRMTVYRWIYKYSLMRKKNIRVVVETKSDTAKIQALKKHISDMEQLLGQKQFEIDFLKKQMEIASEQYGVDLKKKHSGKRSPGFGNSAKNTTTK